MYLGKTIRMVLGIGVLSSMSWASPVMVPETSVAAFDDEQMLQAFALPGDVYRKRYHLTTALQKLVDNRGNGYERLYGVRNFRAVLNGVYYRSGANNAYHRQNKRANSNPMPTDGLKNLCEEGFGRAVYLYSTNYNSAPRSVSCTTFAGQRNELSYLKGNALGGRDGDVKLLIAMIHEHIVNPQLGPIVDHCWNGWHASGFVAAITLRQYCRFSGDEAVKYWNAGTDGNDKDQRFESIRTRIRNFRPYAEFVITAEERSVLCPNPRTLAYSGR